MASAVLVVLVILLSLGRLGEAQSIPDRPSSVTALPIGARAMRVSWSHSGDFGTLLIALNGHFEVIVMTSFNGQSNTTQQMASRNARTVLFTGLTPYSYSSSQGVQATATVQAINERGDRSATMSIGGSLPPCPGVCDYRRFAPSSGCSLPCVCSTAYTGRLCTTPRFVPGDLQVIFTPRGDRDTASLTVKWDEPADETLDGRVLTVYRVEIFTLVPPSSTQTSLFTTSFAPNPDSNGRNNRAIGDTRLGETFNYGVSVTTVTDSEDEATTGPVNVATHAPGPIIPRPSIATRNSVRFEWDPPADADGLITEYTVNLGSGTSNVLIDPSTTTYQLNGLSPSTSYTISITASNSVGAGQSTTITASTETCPSNSYQSGSTCTQCHDNSVSTANSQSIDNCLCTVGYYLVTNADNTRICAACSRGAYKSVEGNQACTTCPDLSTTVGVMASRLEDCNLCRYSDNTYPNDTCYFLDATLRVLNVTIEENSNDVRVSWERPEEGFMATDKHNGNNRLFFLNHGNISCYFTGRGLVGDADITNVMTINITNIARRLSTSTVFGNQRSLVEYACVGRLDVSGLGLSGSVIGPPSDPVTVVTAARDNAAIAALPTILSATRIADGSPIRVSYSIHPNITQFITQFSLEIRQTDLMTQTIFPSPPLAVGSVTVDSSSISLAEEVNTFFSTTVLGGRVYQSQAVTVAVLPATTGDEV